MNCLQEITGVAFDAQGHVLFAGWSSGADVDFGGWLLSSPSFAAKLGADGGHLWSRSITGLSAPFVRGLAACPDGGVLLGGNTGDALGWLQWGGFAARLDAAGNDVWSKQYSTYVPSERAEMLLPGVAVDQDDNAVLAGWFNGTATVGDHEVVSAGMADMLAVKLDGTGAPVWVRRFGDGEQQTGSAVAIDAEGNAIVAGVFRGKLEGVGEAQSDSGFALALRR